MTTRLLEIDVIQNDTISAVALWKFTAAYFEEKARIEGPLVELAMVVLPIVFNEEAVATIYSKQFNGGLFQALSELRTIPVGLQKRMEALAPQTFAGLNIAFASGLLTYDRETHMLLPKRYSDPINFTQEDIKKIIAGAGRLGNWFSALRIEQLSSLLGVRF